MASFNSVTLVGNLIRDVEVRFINGGTAVADVGIAVNKKWSTKDGEKKESVAFVDCTLWGRTAELAAEYLAKGSPVLFQGELVQDTWDDKETGQKRSKLKVKVDQMQFLGGKQDGERQAAPQQSRERQSSGQRQTASPQYAEYDNTPEDRTPF